MTKQTAISTTFTAIILVVAIIVASVGALETVRFNTNTSTNHSNTLPYSSSTSQSLHSTSPSSFTSSSISSTTTSSSTSSLSQPMIVLIYGNATVGEYTGECGGGFYPTGVTFTSSKGINYSSDVTNLSSYPSNQSGPGPRLEGYTAGNYSLKLPNNDQYNMTIQQKNNCVPNDASQYCPAGTLNLDTNAAIEHVNIQSIDTQCVSPSSSTSYGYLIMFQCISGCVQNLTGFGFNETNARMAWGINQSSYGTGTYTGGFSYNPDCGSCNPYTGNGYEYPYPYPTYLTQPLGVYSEEPYVNIISLQFTVAYGGVGNHVYTQGQYPMTIEVSAYKVNGSLTNAIYTSQHSGQPVQTAYITIFPNATSCGGFTVPSSSNVTCS